MSSNTFASFSSSRPHIKPIFQKICAKVGQEPCCDWVGSNGAGHYVKMVHNGIEYGDMQLICECYHMMGALLGMTNDEMAQVSALISKGQIMAINFIAIKF